METVWPKWQAERGVVPVVLSQNTCVRTSLFLQRVLAHEGFAAVTVNNIPRRSEAGPELGPYGFRTSDRWEAHAWVESEDWIIDIAADQFGADAVIATRRDDPRYGRADNDQPSEADARRRYLAVEALWQRWAR